MDAPRRRTVLVIASGLAAILAASTEPGRADAGKALFREITPGESRIDWVHENARSRDRYLPETTGAGVAILDFDGDGWMDVYLVNSGPCDLYRPRVPLANALYRNNRDGTFSDVTAQAGVEGGTFGMGAAVGDYDNDGRPDLYVTGYGRALLYHNEGNGTFTNVTLAAGVAAFGWTTSAAFFDYDGDGHLDLFAGRYVRYGIDTPTSCSGDPHGQRYYCVPRIFDPVPSLLYRNEGGGRFADVSAATGLAGAPGKALGVVATDLDGDGRQDLFVANDTAPNQLFMNRVGARFEDAALRAGVAFSANGKPRSSMGVDAADWNADGRTDLALGNIDHEIFSLYRNDGHQTFVDEAEKNGLVAVTLLVSSWGVKFFDYDNDGWPDLVLANGHPDDRLDGSQGVSYLEPPLLFHNEGGRYRNASAEAGPAFAKAYPARGLAVGDLDNDGRVDLLLTNNGQAPLLLRNESGAGHHWLGVKLQGTVANRDAVGAVVRWSAGGAVREQQRAGGGSYLSSHDPRLVLGLGAARQLDWVEVRWPRPSGRIERFIALGVDRYVTLVEGSGQPVAGSAAAPR